MIDQPRVEYMKNILKTFRVSDDMPVEAPQVTKALDKVQEAVEEKYREIRGQILQFDGILNVQVSNNCMLRSSRKCSQIGCS